MNQTPHSVWDEEPPVDRFHDPAFQSTFNEAREMMGSLARILESSDVHREPDSTMRDLHKTAQRLAAFQAPPTRVVGLVGDSGVGKSSLLNSLLDHKDLARSAMQGAACTCVVTEYHYRDTDTFSIDVYPFTTDELRAQFTEMVSSYRHNYLNSGRMDTPEERGHWEEQSNVAFDTLSAMFRGRMTERFLRSETVTEEQIVETLLHWAAEFGPGTDHVSHTADSLEYCADLLARLTSEQTIRGGAAEWPYIKTITVSLKACVLSKGLVLVDLPGLRDLNSARRNITERYLLKCDDIFAVCPIGRAVSNSSVKDVFDRARQARLSNVSIICTMSDELGQTGEARRGWRGGSPAEIERLSRAISAGEREYEALKSQIEDLLEEIGDIDDEDENSDNEARAEIRDHLHIQRSRLYRQQDRANVALDDRKFDLKQYLIQTRNSQVTAELETEYRKEVPGGNLRVFCAGNELYWTHRNTIPKEKAVPLLQLSGILAIRRHCMSVVSDSQLRIATGYLRGDIPSLLSLVQLWVQSGAGSAAAEQRENIRSALNAFEARLKRDLTGNTSSINRLARRLVDHFDQYIYHQKNFARWRRGAIGAGQIWMGWFHPTYSAFCRNYGAYDSKAVGYHDWNEEAMVAMTQDLEDPWSALYQSISALGDETMSTISDALEGAVDHLEESPEADADSMRPLLEALTTRELLLLEDIEGKHAKLENDALKLRTLALSALRTSFFGQAMEAVYTDAIMESGSGSDRRRKAIINGKLSDEALFPNLMRQFRNEFRALALEFQEEVRNAVAKHLDAVRDTLDIIRSENVARESEQDPAFRRRVAAELERVREVMERGRGALV